MTQIVVNIVAQILGKVLSSIIGLLAITQICRYLTVADFGGYTLAFSFLTLFHPLVDMGLNTIAAREISREPPKTHSLLSELLLIKGILAILAILLIIGLTYLLGYPLGVRHLILVASFSLWNIVLGSLEVLLIVRQRLFWLAISQIFSNMLFLMLVYGVMALRLGVSSLIGVQILSASFSYLLVFWATKGYFRLARPSWLGAKTIFRLSLPQGIASLVTTYYFNIDVVMLSKLMDESAVAYYGAACRLLAFMIFIPHAIMMSLFPILARSRHQDPKAFANIFSFSFYLLLVIGIPVAVWATFYARPIIELIYTSTFGPAVSAFSLLVWGGVGVFASHLAGYTLVVSDRQKFGMLISAFALVANVAMNFWLIPAYGINGAAIATVITEFAVAILGFGLIVYFDRLWPFSWRLLRVLLITVATAGLATLLQEVNWLVASALFTILLASTITYLSLTLDRAVWGRTKAMESLCR